MSLEITFRTLKGSTFKLPASESDTVLDLKRKVAAMQDVSNFAGYRLIYKGKILTDDSTVTGCAISSEGFVVVMPPKKVAAKPVKPATPPAPASVPAPAKPAQSSDVKPSSASTPSSDKMDVTTSVASNIPPASSAPTPSAGAATDESSPSDAASALVTGSAYEESVKRICEMGFPEDQVKQAMRAAFNNPDRAVEFIFNGIPSTPAPPPSTAATTGTETASAVQPSATAPNPTTATDTPAAATAAATASPTSAAPTPSTQNPTGRTAGPGTPFNMFEPQAAGSPTTGGARMMGSLDFLRNMPMFAQIRRLVQANPAALPHILHHLESINPALMTLIDANHSEFTRLINEPLREGEEVNDEAMEQLAQAVTEGGGGQMPSGVGEAGQVYVTEEEGQQIARLTELAHTIGLGQGHVLETWLACNRDETLAANYLVDHADELRADETDDGANNDRTNPPDTDAGAGTGGPPS